MGSILIVTLLAAGVLGASAGTTAIGLDWRKHVFVQEYWENGVPHYLIANERDQKIAVTVHEWQAAKVGRRLEGPWEVGSKAVARFRAARDHEATPVAFQLADGELLGLLHSPVVAAPRAGKIVTYDGLNGSGGRGSAVFTQDQPVFKSGGVIELKLLVPADSGTVTFRKTAEREHPPEAVLTEAVCPTLTVQEGKDVVRIDTGKKDADKAHTVVLRFRAPVVTRPTLVVILGRHMNPKGGSYALARGVLVEP